MYANYKNCLNTSMRDIRIYQNCELSLNTTVQLDVQAARHIAQVLRMPEGAEIILFNGTGNDYLARIVSISKKETMVHIHDRFYKDTESSLRVHLFQGLSKGDRMDTAIQKSVELGANYITPMLCEHTVVRTSSDRNDKKQAHWMNIIINACEQSGRSLIPELFPTTGFNLALSSLESSQTLLLHPDSPYSISNVPIDNGKINLMIGPEGGFSENEISRAETEGVKLVSIGKRILRTETAPVAALSVLQARFGDY